MSGGTARSRTAVLASALLLVAFTALSLSCESTSEVADTAQMPAAVLTDEPLASVPVRVSMPDGLYQGQPTDGIIYMSEPAGPMGQVVDLNYIQQSDLSQFDTSTTVLAGRDSATFRFTTKQGTQGKQLTVIASSNNGSASDTKQIQP